VAVVVQVVIVLEVVEEVPVAVVAQAIMVAVAEQDGPKIVEYFQLAELKQPEVLPEQLLTLMQQMAYPAHSALVETEETKFLQVKVVQAPGYQVVLEVV
jgi:hypothetical protein